MEMLGMGIRLYTYTYTYRPYISLLGSACIRSMNYLRNKQNICCQVYYCDFGTIRLMSHRCPSGHMHRYRCLIRLQYVLHGIPKRCQYIGPPATILISQPNVCLFCRTIASFDRFIVANIAPLSPGHLLISLIWRSLKWSFHFAPRRQLYPATAVMCFHVDDLSRAHETTLRSSIQS